MDNNLNNEDEKCPKCGSDLGELAVTPTGSKLRRCSKGSWDAQTRTATGCNFVKWYPLDPTPLDEKCPKCGSPLVLAVTRFGKKMKKCSKGGWDKVERKATGCDYIEWINGTTEPLSETCPECKSPLVLFTTTTGKRMKKCSTGGWDKVKKEATGCTFVQWLKPGEMVNTNTGEENLPPEN